MCETRLVFALCKAHGYGDVCDRGLNHDHKNAPKLIDPTNMQDGVGPNAMPLHLQWFQELSLSHTLSNGLKTHQPWWKVGCRDEFVLHVALHVPVGDGAHTDSITGKPWRDG